MQPKTLLKPGEYGRLAVDAAEDKLASDIVMLDLRGVCDFADYFVILTADSGRQVRSLAADIESALEQQGAKSPSPQGRRPAGRLGPS